MISPFLFVPLRSALADALEAAWQRLVIWLQGLPADVDLADALDQYTDPVFDQALQDAAIQQPLQQAYRQAFVQARTGMPVTWAFAWGMTQMLAHQQQTGAPVGQPPPAAPASTPPTPPPPPTPPSPGPATPPTNTPHVDFQVVWGLQNKLAVAYAQQRAAEMVGKRRLPDGTLVDNPNAKWAITDTTRQGIKDIVNQAFTDTKSYRDIAQAIRALPGWNTLFGEYRAEMIARTELALATNMGELQSYQAQGGTDVDVVDGTDFDDACRQANGQRWTLAYALDHVVQHPHCTRRFQRVVKSMSVTTDLHKLLERLRVLKDGTSSGMNTSLGLTGYELDSTPACEHCAPSCAACQGKGGTCTCGDKCQCSRT